MYLVLVWVLGAAPAVAGAGGEIAQGHLRTAQALQSYRGATKPPPNCAGVACKRMSDLLPQLRFKTDGDKVVCSCAEFTAGVCFAPGCFPCDKACFTGLPVLANAPGPLGTGLLCSSGCNPCCQQENDINRSPNSTCVLSPCGSSAGRH